MANIPNAPSPAMKRLRKKLQNSLSAHMLREERNGANYHDAIIEVVSVLAEEQAVLFGCIAEPELRRSYLAILMERFPQAVEHAHAATIAAQTHKTVQ